MKLELSIAWRYLFAKKSHNVINVISAISSVGMAIGTAALVLIMSVYNGFDSIIEKNLCDLDPDVLVTPAQGRFFDCGDSLSSVLRCDPEVLSVSEVLEDNVFFVYSDRQSVAIARGVDTLIVKSEAMRSHIVEGRFELKTGELERAAVGSALAYKNGIRYFFSTPLVLYYPDGDKTFSPLTPSSSLSSISVYPSSVFSVNAELDEKLMILSLPSMRTLLNKPNGSSALEVRLHNPARTGDFIRSHNIPGFVLKDRYAQHPSLFRMMKLEKAAIYLILLFVVFIIAFNIFGSLSMLIIEKKEDVGILKALGAAEKFTRNVFVLEGWMISLLGLAAGLVTGLVAAFVQQITGAVKMPGNFLCEAYPVVVEPLDIILIAAGVAVTGLLIALAAVRTIRNN